MAVHTFKAILFKRETEMLAAHNILDLLLCYNQFPYPCCHRELVTLYFQHLQCPARGIITVLVALKLFC